MFAAAGIDAPPPVPLPWGPGEQTLAGNANGGLYLVPGALLGRLSAAWAHWARWLLDRTELLAGWAVHVDQVAMALALRAEGVTPSPWRCAGTRRPMTSPVSPRTRRRRPSCTITSG